jgi:phosphate transport system substrate-binding protein
MAPLILSVSTRMLWRYVRHRTYAKVACWYFARLGYVGPGQTGDTPMRKQPGTVVYYGRLLAFAIASAAMVFAGDATAGEEIKIGGTGHALGAMRLLGETFSRRNPDIKVTVLPSLGSGGGIRAVAKGVIDIAVTARPLAEDERGSGLVESEYARTPFVFVVSTKSNVTAITTDQIADLYAGRTQKWPDGSPIRFVLRATGEADTDLIKKMTPGIAEALTRAEKSPGRAFAITDQENASDIERIPGAIGSTTLGLIKSENRSLRALDLNGVAATVQNAVAGRYPHYKRLFVVTLVKQAGAVPRFLAFLRSADGAEILVRNGHWTP